MSPLCSPVIALLIAASRPGASGPTASPAYDAAECMTCHAKLLTNKVKHASSRDCAGCHVPARTTGNCGSAVAKHWSFTAALPEQCYACHSRVDGKRSTHSAVKQGQCAACHDPHSSENPRLLRARGARLCFRCHEDDATGRVSLHMPVAEGMCTECHDAHGGEYAKSTTLAGRELCAQCHDRIGSGRNTHPILDVEGCAPCHDAHASDHRALLVQEVNTLCRQCHGDKADGLHVTNFLRGGHRVSGVPDPHAPDRDLNCASCHDPHGSDGWKLLRYGNSAMEFCDWCHGDRSGNHPELKDIHRVKRPAKPATPAAGAPGADARPVGGSTNDLAR